MPKLNLKAVPNLKPNPIFKGLPKKLKDPKNFLDIEKQLQDVIKSDHQHKNIKEFITCAWCQENRERRQKLMKKLGFKGIGQYLTWKKIMTLMINKKDFPLV